MLIDTKNPNSRLTVYVVGEMYRCTNPADPFYKTEQPRWIVRADSHSEAIAEVLESYGQYIAEGNCSATVELPEATDKHRFRRDSTKGDWVRILYVAEYAGFDYTEFRPAASGRTHVARATVNAFGIVQNLGFVYMHRWG